MPSVTFSGPEKGKVREYPWVALHDSGWVVATDTSGSEKWFPPHRIARVRFPPGYEDA